MAVPIPPPPGATDMLTTLVSDVEPGYKTTEFWGKVTVQAVGVLTMFGVAHPSSATVNALSGLAAVVVPELVYALGRSIRKKA